MGRLSGSVAVVAGGTRAAGRGIAVALGAEGATVYVTGRSTRAQRSAMNRPETIEDSADQVTAAGGRGIVRHHHRALVHGIVHDLPFDGQGGFEPRPLPEIGRAHV